MVTVPSTKRRLTPTATAAKLEVSPPTLYAWVRKGEAPPSYRVGGRRYFDEAEVDRWIAERQKVAS